MQEKPKSLHAMVSDSDTPFTDIMVSNDLLHAIKNQDSLLPRIFTKPNVELIISYIVKQHSLIEGNAELSYKLPFMAMEILCCQCHHLTEIVFKVEASDSRPTLLCELLSFLEYDEHYLLTGYFSKVMINLTKRVFSATHKHNLTLCREVFERGMLMKSCNHMYSGSTNEYVIKWLTLKAEGNNYIEEKWKFVETLIQYVNEEEVKAKNWGKEARETAVSLIMLLLRSPLEPPPPQPQPMQHQNTNLNVNKTAQKELYSFVCQDPCIEEILKPITNPNLQKLNLIKRVLKQFRTQNQELKKINDEYEGLTLSMFISSEMLSQCFYWVNQCISEIVSTQAQSHKLKIIGFLQVLHELHLLPEMKEKITDFYEEKQLEHVEIIVELLNLKNNIIQNILTKIVMTILEDFQCPDFSRVLLHEGLTPLFDEEGIREHILKWAQIIMSQKNQKFHIYESVEEESKWEHMAEVIHEAELIQIGEYRFSPSPLNICYSFDKIRQTYSKFLQQGVVIEYEEKPISTKKKDSIRMQKKKTKVQENEQTKVEWERPGYMKFDLIELLDEL